MSFLRRYFFTKYFTFILRYILNEFNPVLFQILIDLSNSRLIFHSNAKLQIINLPSKDKEQYSNWTVFRGSGLKALKHTNFALFHIPHRCCQWKLATWLTMQCTAVTLEEIYILEKNDSAEFAFSD